MVALMDMVQLCPHIGALIKTRKSYRAHHQSTTTWYLLDTINQEAKLPDDKLAALLSELAEFKTMAMTQQTCSKRNLLSLIGKVSFACKVVPAGRMFLRHLLNVAHLTIRFKSLVMPCLTLNSGSNLPQPAMEKPFS